MSILKYNIRSIHHFACTGGTVISKCIQSMHSTIVLSEVHPDNTRYVFNPYDPIQLFLAQTNLRNNQTLRRQIFSQRIEQCVNIAKQLNLNLVLREHTHSDYCLVKDKETISSKNSLLDVISIAYNVKSLVTVRNPLESYISLQKIGAARNVLGFADYCDRLEMMTNRYAQLGIPFMRYEDFCTDPSKFMEKLCEYLELRFNPDFQSLYKKMPMTGNSGRGLTENLETIKILKPKKVSEDLRTEALRSESFANFSKEFGYSLDY